MAEKRKPPVGAGGKGFSNQFSTLSTAGGTVLHFSTARGGLLWRRRHGLCTWRDLAGDLHRYRERWEVRK